MSLRGSKPTCAAMLAMKTWAPEPSSNPPMGTPAKKTIGSPASTRSSNGPENPMLISASPEARAFETPAPPVVLTYWTSVNPSPHRNSSARYSGAAQRAGLRVSLIFVVSGGGSAATGLGYRPSSPAVPARVSPPRKRRRVHPAACGAFMGTSSRSQRPYATGRRRECRRVGEGCQSSRPLTYTCGRDTVGFSPHGCQGGRLFVIFGENQYLTGRIAHRPVLSSRVHPYVLSLGTLR